jgi:cardiolipin synthase (CMP-forming)
MNMNLPNALTMLRIVLVPFFLVFLVYGYYKYALATFVVAGVTDALDGTLARLMEKKTELGAILDPLADKLLAVAAFVSLTWLGKIPLWLTLAVIFRDVVIVSGSAVIYVLGYDLKIRPLLMGKVTTGLQLALVVAALVGLYIGHDFALKDYLVWLTLAFTVATGARYIVIGFRMVGHREGQAG